MTSGVSDGTYVMLRLEGMTFSLLQSGLVVRGGHLRNVASARTSFSLDVIRLEKFPQPRQALEGTRPNDGLQPGAGLATVPVVTG